MADYVNITDSMVDPDAPVTSDLMYRMRDNPIAIAEGAAGAPLLRLAGAFNGEAPSSGGGVLAVPAFAASLPSAYYPDKYLSANGDPPPFRQIEVNYRFMAVGSGQVRVQSNDVSVSGSGSVELYLGGTLIQAAGNGQGINSVVTYGINDIIRLRVWKAASGNSVSVSNIQLRISRRTLAFVPWFQDVT